MVQILRETVSIQKLLVKLIVKISVIHVLAYRHQARHIDGCLSVSLLSLEHK